MAQVGQVEAQEHQLPTVRTVLQIQAMAVAVESQIQAILPKAETVDPELSFLVITNFHNLTILKK
jgi:hypothetical protein